MFGQFYNSGQKVLQKSQEGEGEVWISGYDFAHNIKELKKNGIYAVCSGVDLGYKYPEQITQIKFDLDDYNGQDARHVFKPAYQFIDEQRKKTNVLIHCAAGISRCSLLLISYMMRRYKWNYQTCLTKIKKARSCCQPNTGFVKQLEQLQKQLDIPN